jgi:hypothetical protein
VGEDSRTECNEYPVRGLQRVSVTDGSIFGLVALWNINGHVKFRFRGPSTTIMHIHDPAYCLLHVVSMRDRQDSLYVLGLGQPT